MAAPRLKMIRGPEIGREYELEADTITIGRGINNTVIIRDNEISKEHCRLVRVLDDYEIYDVASTNGTFVNGQRVGEQGWLLTPGNRIELGYSILLEYVSAEQSSEFDGPLVTSDHLNADSNAYYLVVRRGGKQLDDYRLDSPEMFIGRSMDNDIVISEPEVSKKHIRLTRQPDTYLLEDLSSLNGTYINDLRVDEPIVLQVGDVIKIGTKLEIWFSSEPATRQRITDTHETPHPAPDTVPSISALAAMQTPLSLPVASTLDPDELMNHVFIAYARADWEELVVKLFASLQDSGVPVYVNQHLAPESETFKMALEQALDECICLIVVVSPASLNQPYVRHSIKHFLVKDKPVLLLRYKDTPLPITLQKAPSVIYNPQQPGRAFAGIVTELRRLNVFR